jgi:hypothetical protein
MASPYFPEDIGEEELQVPRLRMGAEAYAQILERAQRLHIEPPSEIVTYALSLFFQLTRELEEGTRIHVTRGTITTELVLPHPTREGEPLLARTDFSPPAGLELAGQPRSVR